MAGVRTFLIWQVNTKPLDGESDTKLRIAPHPVASRLTDVSARPIRAALRGSVQCEAPNDKASPPTPTRPRALRHPDARSHFNDEVATTPQLITSHHPSSYDR